MHRKPRSEKILEEELLNARDKITLDFKEIKQFTTCDICKNNIFEAITLQDCLHSFCKVCIYSTASNSNSNCPTCGSSLGTNPESLFSPDPILQSIIGKLSPSKLLDLPDLPEKEHEITVKFKIDKAWVYKIYGAKGREFCFAYEQFKSTKGHPSSTLLELKKCILKKLTRARGLDIYCKDQQLDESWTLKHLYEAYPGQDITIKPHLI